MQSLREIHRGTQTRICVDLAEKRAHKALLGFANVAPLRRALLREADLQCAAAGTGVIPIDFVDSTGQEARLIVRPFIHGRTLAEVSSLQQRVPPAARWTAYPGAPALDAQVPLDGLARGELFLALQQVHDRGLIHRDLSPANVLVDVRGRVFINDFGLARWQDESPLADDELHQGTRSCLAPEVLAGRQPSAASDVHQAARCVLALLGEHPALPAALQAALAPHPEDRPSARDIAAALQQTPVDLHASGETT